MIFARSLNEWWKTMTTSSAQQRLGMSKTTFSARRTGFWPAIHQKRIPSMSTSPKTRRSLQRAAQMSGKEVKFRVYQQLWNRWESFRQGKGCGAAFEDDGIADSNASPQSMRFFFSPADLPLLVNTLRARFPEASAKTIQQAERICTHRFDLLGYTNLDFGRPINWHFDPISGKQTPLMKSYDLPYLEFGIVGDSKIIWEL